VRLESQALPKAVAAEANQNKPADDDQGMQHGGWSAASGGGFKGEAWNCMTRPQQNARTVTAAKSEPEGSYPRLPRPACHRERR
jgi:hypothetical protein